MPNVMTRSAIIEPSRKEALRNFGCVKDCANEVHCNTLEDWCVEVKSPVCAAGHNELSDRNETSRAKEDVEANACPRHVGAIESRVPWQDYTADAEASGQHHVGPSTDRLAVESGVFGSHDRGGDQKGDAGVVNAGKAVENCD